MVCELDATDVSVPPNVAGVEFTDGSAIRFVWEGQALARTTN